LKKGTDLFTQKATQDELSLVTAQKDLEKQTSIKLVGYSLSQTVTALYVVGGDAHDSKAHKLKSEYKIPNNRYSWIKVRALARGKHWEALRKYAKSEPDIGYKPFAEVCLANGNKEEALLYIKKVNDQHERALLYGRAEAWQEALNTVQQIKSSGVAEEVLWKLKAACNSPQVHETIKEMIRNIQES